MGYLTGLGDDEYSAAMRAAWRAEGIADHAIPCRGALPGLYAISTADDGERASPTGAASPRRGVLFAGAGPLRAHRRRPLHLSGITLQLMPRVRAALLARLASDGPTARGQLDTNYRPAAGGRHGRPPRRSPRLRGRRHRAREPRGRDCSTARPRREASGGCWPWAQTR